jgi:hypothetical protein
VIAWIGEEIDDTPTAVAYLEGVARGDEQWSTEELQKCMTPIFRRPYWRRTWIVQEIVLAADVCIVSRSQSFS